MGFLNFFKREKTSGEQFAESVQELQKELFPGGAEELRFRARKVSEISNGKLNLENAARVFTCAKARIKIAITMFDGVTHLGIKSDDLIQKTIADSEKKLSTFESAAINYYALYDKNDPAIDAHNAIHDWSCSLFGLGGVGVELDEIPSGIGEFGLDPTNAIPVRGILSNQIYLDRLCTIHGLAVNYQRLGSLVVPNIIGRLDEYQILLRNEQICKLYISPYNQKISERPPKGFLLVKRD